MRVTWQWICLWAAMFLLGIGSAHSAEKVTLVYTDPQGNVLAETDINGNITATFDYRPYGVIALGMAPNGPGYTGHVNDADSALVYMQARYYDPSIGRFLSIDDQKPVFGNTFKFNRFSYGNNDPIGDVDLDGRESACVSQKSHCSGVGASGVDNVVGVAKAIINRDADFHEKDGDEGEKMSPSNESQDRAMVATDAIISTIIAITTDGESTITEAGGLTLSSEQASNVSRFMKKIPANSKDSVTFKELPNGGVAVQATSPGRVPGSSAVYEKQIDSTGKTVGYSKTSYDQNGNIIHSKNKLKEKED